MQLKQLVVSLLICLLNAHPLYANSAARARSATEDSAGKDLTFNSQSSSVNYTIGLKTLILSSDDIQTVLPEQVLKAYGADYTVLNVVKQFNVTKPDGSIALNATIVDDADIELYDAMTGQPKYMSIVYTSTTLGYHHLKSDFTLEYVGHGLSAFTRSRIERYCIDYSVRRVILNTYPADIGDPTITSVVGVTGLSSDNITSVSFIEDNTMPSEIHNALKLNASIRIGMETEFNSNRYWLAPARIDPMTNQDRHVIPILDIVYNTEEKTTRNVGALVHSKVGTPLEDMYFFFTADIYGLHGPTLGHMWFPWVTRGLFLGERKVVLDTQVNEYFMDGLMYNTKYDRPGMFNETQPPFTYRLTADDLDYHVHAQGMLNFFLPEGSNYTIQMAINGKGAADVANVADSSNLNEASVKNFDEFLWISHSWNRLDMYCINSDCATPPQGEVDTELKSCYDYDGTCVFATGEPSYPASGYTPYEYNVYEISRNQYFAETYLKVEDQMNKARWSSKSIVNFRSSGYNYTEAVEAMFEKGIRYASGGTRDVGENPWHLRNVEVTTGADGKVLSNAEKKSFAEDMENRFGVETIKVIPRITTRVFKDVSTNEQLEMEFNSIYGPNCHGATQADPIGVNGSKCNKDSFKYAKNLTADGIMAIDGFEGARNLLFFRADPYQFNQMNMRVNQETTFKESLMMNWVYMVISWVTDYTSFPVYTYKLDDLAEQYNLREKRDACGVSAAVQFIGGKAHTLWVTGTDQCDAKLTFTKTSGSTGLEPRSIPFKTSGSTDNVYTTPLNNNSVAIPLAGSI